MKPTWVTFYSYKGGVGRTMALANVAGRLARLGRRVVLIDFDLEAPGLDAFRELSTGGQPGVVEYVHQFLQDRKPPPIEAFIHLCPASAKTPGKLWLMPSGRKDGQYAARLHAITWSDLYERKIAQPLIANWKQAIERTFAPDYVLIDSRTGLTDVGGVCTLHFPDINVLFFALNEQNVAGTAAVLRTISQAAVSRPIDVLTVASPVPNLPRDNGVLGRRIRAAETQLGAPLSATISYFAPLALEERIWTLGADGSLPAVLSAYESLTTSLTRRARDGLDFYLAQGEELVRTGAPESAAKLATVLLDQFGDRPDALRMAAQLARFQGNRDEATRIARRILELDPTDLVSFKWVTGALRARGDLPALQRLIREVTARITPSIDPAKTVLLFEAGHLGMQLHDYQHATWCYLRAAACRPADAPRVQITFNCLEAKRRATRTLDRQDWTRWQELAAEAEPLISNVLQLQNDRQHAVTTANTLQALAGAHAILGRLDRARDLLTRSDLVARALNPAVRIFSVIDYDYIERDRFLARNAEFARALARGELWDGMKVPPTFPDHPLPAVPPTRNA